MTPKEYFENVIKLYQDARKSKFPYSGIGRGRSHSISGDIEDLTAKYIASNNPDECTYYIDQPMCFKDKSKKNGKRIRYPDIVLQNKDGSINHLIDTKADIGWNRDGMPEFCKKWHEIIEENKGQPTKFLHGKTKERIEGNFAKNLIYHIVIISNQNQNQNKKFKQMQEQVEADFENVRLYVLSTDYHPNNYDADPKEVLRKININEDEFSRLMKNLSEI